MKSKERTIDAGTEGRMYRSVEEFVETWNAVQINGKISGTKEMEFTLRLPVWTLRLAYCPTERHRNTWNGSYLSHTLLP